MEIFNRATLKGFFQKGRVPTEVHFSNLIDSTINKIDDGFAKTVEHGLKLSPGGDSRKLMSLYDDIKEKDPLWDVSLNPTETVKGLSISEKEGGNRLFLQNGGEVGIGTITPAYQLDIEGTVGMKSRVGTYQTKAEVPADSEWHIIIDQLEGCHAFEIVAKVQGLKGRGKFAMAHAIAVSTHGSTGSKIRATRAHSGWFLNQLRFRWKRAKGKYRLEMKTGDHYGTDKNNKVIQIKYHISSLWDNRLD